MLFTNSSCHQVQVTQDGLLYIIELLQYNFKSDIAMKKKYSFFYHFELTHWKKIWWFLCLWKIYLCSLTDDTIWLVVCCGIVCNPTSNNFTDDIAARKSIFFSSFWPNTLAKNMVVFVSLNYFFMFTYKWHDMTCLKLSNCV